MVTKPLFHIVAQYERTEYPTLMFFKPGAISSVIHGGNKDWDTIVAFIDEQMRREPTKMKVGDKSYLAKFEICRS